MTTNSVIQKALNDILIAASLGYDIAWPGLNFTAPDSGAWLEVTFLPNRGFDDGVNGNSSVIPQGLYQVVAASRPQSLVSLTEIAEQVQAAFPKGTVVTDSIAINRAPYQGTAQFAGDRMSIAVTIEYSG